MPDLKEPLGKRVVKALNNVLCRINLKEHDYLLRVDADTILPSRFIEENLKTGAHCVGKAGYAMLLNMSCFIKVFRGRFAEVGAEDSYITLKLLSQGFIVKSWSSQPKLKRKSGKSHTWRCFFVRGLESIDLATSCFMLFILYFSISKISFQLWDTLRLC